MFRLLKMKWLIWRGKAIDIWSKNDYPSNVLSNLYDNKFCFDGMECESMEGFLQSLKYKDTHQQQQICSMTGKEAKKATCTDWQTEQTVWWKGVPINRQGEDFQKLVRMAYNAMFEQSVNFQKALMATKDKILYHYRGEQNPCKTILTGKEFCSILTEMRDAHYKRN